MKPAIACLLPLLLAASCKTPEQGPITWRNDEGAILIVGPFRNNTDMPVTYTVQVEARLQTTAGERTVARRFSLSRPAGGCATIADLKKEVTRCLAGAGPFISARVFRVETLRAERPGRWQGGPATR